MSLVRLFHSGLFDSSPNEAKDAAAGVPDFLDKRAMFCFAGSFDSMDGPVDVTEEDLAGLVDEHNSTLACLSRLVNGDVPVNQGRPLQLDHSRSARDTVGRVRGPLEMGKFKMEDGKEVPALFGSLRVLGRENVERVLDGRWSELSLGADFKTRKLVELTITPFPAAEGSAMLAKKTLSKGEPEMDKAKLKKHLMDCKKMSEEDADKHLAALSKEDEEKLSKEVDDEEKKLASESADKDKKEKEEKDKADLAAKDAAVVKLTAKKEQITKLTSDFRKANEEVRLAARKANIYSRLSTLKASAKITPAEMKKIDLTELAKKDDVAVEAVLKTYNDREPVIPTGALGTIKAVELSALGDKEARLAKSMEERKKSMPFTSRALAASAKAKGEGPKRLSSMSDDVDIHIDTTPHEHIDLDKEYDGICMTFDSSVTEGKKQLKGFLDRMKKRLTGSPEDVPQGVEQMSALVEKVGLMQNQFEQVILLATELAGTQQQ